MNKIDLERKILEVIDKCYPPQEPLNTYNNILTQNVMKIVIERERQEVKKINDLISKLFPNEN